VNKNKQILFLRIGYWVGAIFDALVIIPLLFPKVAAIMFGVSNFIPGNDYKYVMYIAASLMAGWTALLIWADRNPIERKGILLLTIFPVLIGLLLAGVFAVQSGFITRGKMLPIWIMQILLVLILSFSYLYAKNLK
jgi:hypothetical protein